MSRSKIGMFYFMHIPWTWAKQRPQFLAQELSDVFDIHVAFKAPFSQKNQSVEKAELSLLSIRMLPYNARSAVVRFFNKYLTKISVRKTYASSKYVWVTSPDLYDLLPPLAEGQVLVYDCMDDMLSFSAVKDFPHVLKYYQFAEKKLVRKADIIICSSDNLKDKLISRYQPDTQIHVVNNGIADGLFKTDVGPKSNILKIDQTKTNIVYIGTIAKWMDWTLILKSLELNSNLLYHFVGPQETPVPVHARIISYGPKPHKEIKGMMADADILFMPFVVTDLIKSVNPVKLYEYIYSGKPSISVRYKETEKFEDFVYLYSDIEEYLTLIETIEVNKFLAKRGLEESIEFCYNNTWTIRGEALKSIL